MQIPLLSRERLTRPDLIADLKRLFVRYGALGGAAGMDTPPIAEETRLSLVPLVFGLLPIGAVERVRYDVKVKPLIREHLNRLGIPEDDELLEVLKTVSDQFFLTKDKKSSYSAKKFKISDLRALKSGLYDKIKERQKGRCALCGALFDGHTEETLDHIIPWRLLGDIQDGSNWQILCRPCNTGKGNLISIYQSPEALNWIYSKREFVEQGREALSEDTRYVILAAKRSCACGITSAEDRLFVQKNIETAIPVADAYHVACSAHVDPSRPSY